MCTARAMKMTVNEVIDMVAVWNSFVPTICSMLVLSFVAATGVVWGARGSVSCTLRNFVFVYMITMNMVHTTIMQIVNVVVVFDRFMTTIRTMLMAMFVVRCATHSLNLLAGKASPDESIIRQSRILCQHDFIQLK